MRERVRLWPAYPWRGLEFLGILVPVCWFLWDAFSDPTFSVVAELIFGLFFAVLALFCVHCLVAHLVLTKDRLETRGLWRWRRIERSDVVAFHTRPFLRWVMIRIELVNGTEVRLPWAVQGSLRSQQRLLRQLESWWHPESPSVP